MNGRLVQIVGQNSSWSFASSVSPGTPHVISYLATDDDNLNWTCTFTITAETPTCSAITHLENGVLNCTDDNLRASRCEFLCDHAIPCENNITSVLADGRLEADCGNASLEFGNVCWLTCKDNFRLRNPALEQSILGRQQDDFINASLLYDAARNASTVAIFETAEATEQLNKRKAEVADAQDVVDIRAAQLHATITEVTSLTAVISESQENLEQAQQELADALANDNSDEILVAELTNNVNALNQTLIEHLAEIESKEKEIEGIEQLLGEAQVAFAHAHEAEVNATKLADEKSALATELQIKADDLLKQLNETDTLYAAVANHSRSVDKVVPTPVLCNANGTWEVMGSPVCEDDESPVLKCIPVITWYFEPNVTSGEVTWIEPEVDDNGGNVHVEKISGPDSVEVCPFPTAPTNGNVECEFTEMSENTTDVTSGNETEEGVTCTFSCDVGYMLPYRTPNTFTCNIEGIWSSDMFPKACIETGEEHISKYHFYLMYTNSSCDTSEQDAFLELWSSVLTSDMTSYPACMSGYTCHLGDMLSGCESYTGRVLVEFSIFIGCEQVLATESCPAGYFSANGLQPCLPCVTGSYQHEEATSTCITCNPDTWTLGEGSTSASDCIDISGLSVANTSVTSDNMAQLYAECGAKLPEASVGLDTLAGMRLPEAKFTATTCKASNATLEADHCGLHACQNGGVCERHVTGPGYSCACVEPWGGLFCDEELVHGGWGEWVWVGECSRTCGNGTRQRFRHCNNPVSSLYGDECNGTSTETVECFIQDCPVCGAPISVGGVTCELIDGECEVTCPPGYKAFNLTVIL
ncbi:TSP1-like protein [Mya arenaria]|uniref:TSP1-like protein n=1 Tax=Mya arenaria TaxID=6604 RepID=A0ABY7G879_MYAAR|nr:TSP1-like protein [Mya arenaria]